MCSSDLDVALGNKVQALVELDRAVLGQPCIAIYRVPIGRLRCRPLLQDEPSRPDLQGSGHLRVADGIEPIESGHDIQPLEAADSPGPHGKQPGSGVAGRLARRARYLQGEASLPRDLAAKPARRVLSQGVDVDAARREGIGELERIQVQGQVVRRLAPVEFERSVRGFEGIAVEGQRQLDVGEPEPEGLGRGGRQASRLRIALVRFFLCIQHF